MMKISMTLEPVPSQQWQLARQIGVEGAVFHFLSHYLEDPSVLSYKNLNRLTEELEKEDLRFLVSEGDPFPMDKVKLGLPDRDKDVAAYCDYLRILGDLGVPQVCYNFMVGMNWARTRTDIRLRGGALASGFVYADMKEKSLETRGVDVTTELVWDNLYYFLDRVLPVAEAAGVRLSLHPDDPPIESFCNVKRIIASPDAYRKIFRDYPSPMNGMTFCQSNFKLMGGDLYELAEEFAKSGRVFFIHFRDVTGDKYDFHETFHDDGPSDMARLMNIYRSYANSAPIRPDHVPTLAGEDNGRFGYTLLGRLHAIGYMQGLIQACDFAAREKAGRSTLKRYGCSVCGYTYDPAREEAIDEAGEVLYIRFDELPEGWRCPQCESPKNALKEL